MTTPFLVPWHVRVLRLFLPQAPGTDPALYKNMMANVVSKIEYPYRTYLQEKKKHQNALLGYDDSIRAVLTKELFVDSQPPSGSDPLGTAEVYCRGSMSEMMALYEAWEWYVKRVVPPHRLIVFEIGKDSWERLSSALNVSIPRTNPLNPIDPVDNPPIPFPFVNTTGDYYTMMMGQRLLACLLLVSSFLLMTLAGVGVWYCCCRRRRRIRDDCMNTYYSEMYHEDDANDEDVATTASRRWGGSNYSAYKED